MAGETSPMSIRRWTVGDFEQMSWHDCHVHAMRVLDGEYGAGELELDLDYIVEWRRESERFSFVLVPAWLRFHEVSGLRIALDWATPTAGVGPFSLARVERTLEVRPRYTASLWRLEINWPRGSIEFESSGFTQTAWGEAAVSDQQCLKSGERRSARAD